MRLKNHLFEAATEACLNTLIPTGSRPIKQVVLSIKKRSALTPPRLLLGCATLAVSLAIVFIPHIEIRAQARIIYKMDKPVGFTVNRDVPAGSSEQVKKLASKAAKWIVEGRVSELQSGCDIYAVYGVSLNTAPPPSHIASDGGKSYWLPKGFSGEMFFCGNLDDATEDKLLALTVRIHNPTNTTQILPLGSTTEDRFFISTSEGQKKALAYLFKWDQNQAHHSTGWGAVFWRTNTGQVTIEVQPGETREAIYVVPNFVGDATITLTDVGTLKVKH